MNDDLQVIQAVVKTFDDMKIEAVERVMAYLAAYAMQRMSKELVQIRYVKGEDFDDDSEET